MIDTVKFKVSGLSNDFLDLLKKKSMETSKKNNDSGEKLFTYYNAVINLPSYNRQINIFFDEFKEGTIYFELSIPKFIFGNNLILCSVNQFHTAIQNLHKLFTTHFGQFPQTDCWQITRLDICYAWKLPDQDQALSMIRILKAYHFPRHKIYPYSDSVYSVSENQTTKFYLKQPEFKKHDMPKLLKHNLTDEAYEVYNDASGVLRFEVELRRDALKRKFEKEKIRLSDITEECINSLLFEYFNKIMKNKSTTIESAETIFKKLEIFYGRRKALRLFSFYSVFSNPDTSISSFTKSLHRSSVYRNLRLIAEAGVGLPIDPLYGIDSSFDFSIPSKNVVQYKKYADRASAGAYFLN